MNQLVIRTATATMDSISKAVKNRNPRVVYNELIERNSLADGPKDLQQVRSKKYNDKRKLNDNPGHVKNLADQLLHVINMSRTHPTVKLVTNSKYFGVVLITGEQINDIKRFCCSGLTPMGIDTTFNPGEVFVTAFSYKQLSVTNSANSDHSIILGPVFLHGASTFE